MSGFVPGIELSRSFYTEVVGPLATPYPHSAALVGPGSEVLEFDTERSTDHDWGPRVLLFVDPHRVEEVEEKVRAGLPDDFGGYPTVFGPYDRRRHGVTVTAAGPWLRERLGFDPRQSVTLLDRLATPWQSMAEMTGGEVFHDGLGDLGAARTALRWYPDDVWRYVMAGQWRRIAQEEGFAGRCAEVGDELGSAVVAARLAREVMRLALLQRRRYPPYTKWLGSALNRLSGAAELGEALKRAVAARTWAAREEGLGAAYERVASWHNRLALTEPLEGKVRPLFGRPFQVIGGDRFADALLDSITDPQVGRLPQVGCIDQLCDNPDILVRATAARSVTAAALTLTDHT